MLALVAPRLATLTPMFAANPPSSNGFARAVQSPQREVHPRLASIVLRHLTSASRAPIPEHTRDAFASVAQRIAAEPRPLVLDSGCGTGHSSLTLARSTPEAWVIGIDRSQARLARGPFADAAGLPQNLLLIRAEIAGFWRLARAAGWQLARHCLYYPNPYPKPDQLMRRWHAHPALVDLLALGGALELRSNWAIYVEEFAQALQLAGIAATVEPIDIQAPVTTLFERKYAAAGQTLYRLTAVLDDAPTVRGLISCPIQDPG